MKSTFLGIPALIVAVGCLAACSSSSGPSGNESEDSGTDAGGTGSADGSSKKDSGKSGGTDSGSGKDSSSEKDTSTSDATSRKSDGGAGDGGDAARSGFPFPPVVYSGGPIVTAPKIVTIAFAGDPLATSFGQFGAQLASSAYWDTIRAGYCASGTCIGDGPVGTSVTLSTAPAGTYTDSTQGGPSTLQTFLAGLISAQTVPAPDANTIYALYLPPSTTVNLDGSLSCGTTGNGFDGYHWAMTSGSGVAYYAVINECTAPPGEAVDLLQNTTITTSHETIETASDGSDTAFGFTLDFSNQATFGWDDILGYEIADLCVDQFSLGQDKAVEDGFTVQRVWSMTNAAAGTNPCVPVPAGEVYFNTFPTVNAVVENVGESQTIDVQALADGPMGEWIVVPQDWTLPASGGSKTYVTFALPGAADGGAEIQVKSGDTFQVTVTLIADPSSLFAGQFTGPPGNEADAVLVSANGTSTTATEAHFWPFVVMTPTEAAANGVTVQRRTGAHPLVRAGGRFFGDRRAAGLRTRPW